MMYFVYMYRFSTFARSSVSFQPLIVTLYAVHLFKNFT